MADQFYLQHSRSHAYAGDGLSFWGAKGACYITDLDKAELFTLEQATGHRETDIPWTKDYIDAHTRLGVDCQVAEIREALNQHPDAADFYRMVNKLAPELSVRFQAVSKGANAYHVVKIATGQVKGFRFSWKTALNLAQVLEARANGAKVNIEGWGK